MATPTSSALRHPDRRSRGPWVAFLGGPLLASVHFLAVYLYAEGACVADDTPSDVAGIPTPSFVVLVVTVVFVAAIVPIVVLAAQLLRRGSDDETGDAGRFLARVGLGLAVGSLAVVVSVGLPAAVLQPC